MTKVISIVHVIHRFDTGGLENGVVNLINHLESDRYRHHIVTMKGHNLEFAARIKTNNVSFTDLAKKDGHDFSVFFRFNQILKKIKPDVLHTRNTATIEMQLVGWWRRISLRIHGEHGWDVNDMHGQNLRYQKLRRFIKRFVHQYVALSSEARDYLLTPIRVEPDRVNHICNGVNVERFAPRDKPQDLLPKGFDDSFVIGTVGRLAEVKNQPYLLEGFIALLDQKPEFRQKVKLVIVGDGILKDKLQKRASEANVIEDVWLAGDRSDIPQLLNSMDVFVLPSLAEGISNTILEAMASGLPTIATKTGGNPDLIPDSMATDHLVTVNDVNMLVSIMKQYVESQQLLDNNSKLVRAHCVERFSIATMVNKYHQLYQGVVVKEKVKCVE